jgi:CubicO group peptidase (beta-lactamase class C family)
VFTHTSEGIPGDHYEYNGDLFDNLTDVVMAASGKRYRVVLAQEIVEKIGLTSTAPGNDFTDVQQDQKTWTERLGVAPLARYEAAVSALAKPYRLSGEKEIVPSHEWMFGIGAANGVVTTVLDLAKFDSAIDRHELVRPETQELAWTPARSNSGQTLPYGLGWFVQTVGMEKIVWHNGNLPDRYSALLLKVPHSNLTLALLANSDALSSPFKLAKGDVLNSAFACTFLEDFVLPPDGDRSCKKRSNELLTAWLER